MTDDHLNDLFADARRAKNATAWWDELRFLFQWRMMSGLAACMIIGLVAGFSGVADDLMYATLDTAFDDVGWDALNDDDFGGI